MAAGFSRAAPCLARTAGPRPALRILHRLSAKSPMSYASRGQRPLSTEIPAAAAPPPPPPTSSDRQLSFHLAASYIGKGIGKFDPKDHVFDFDPSLRSHFPDQVSAPLRQRPQSGHDAFFISSVGQDGTTALGVADGVGGWVDLGVDPGDFSHALCRYMAAAAAAGSVSPSPGDATGSGSRSGPGPALTPQSMMEIGYTASCRDRRLRAGGSTACVALASPDGKLDVANLGDSGYLVLRASAVHTFSPSQTHAFNTPFQLSLVPQQIVTRIATFGGSHHIDMPADSDLSRVELRRGDVVLLATDGLWDNLYNQDVLRVANQVMMQTGGWELREGEVDSGVRVSDRLETLVRNKSGPAGAAEGRDVENRDGEAAAAPALTLPAQLAMELTVAARAASVQTKGQSPFSKSIKHYYPDESWDGGKVDDICVVIMVVADKSPQLKPRL